jgi:hypothetical protein
MPLDPASRFSRAKDFESRIAGLEFSPEVWAVFSLLEQPVNAQEIAAALLTPVPKVLEALETLSAAGLIQAKAIGWAEFAQRPKSALPAATRAEGDALVAIRLAPALARPSADVSLRLGRPPTPPPAAATPPEAAPGPGWKLRPALDAIAQSAGGGVPGQLLVYKVFLQLPAPLLQAAGIESVAAVGPEFIFRDPRLRDSLIEAARAHATVDLSAHFAS